MNPEILGFIASSIIVLSGAMKGEKMLRAVNAVGATMMVIYGIMIHAPSVAVLNAILTVMHIIAIYNQKGEGNAKRDAPEQPKGSGRE